MQIHAQTLDGVLVLAPIGRLDTVTAKDLDDRITAAIEAGQTRLVLDLKGLAYISSFGLRVVLMAAKKLQGDGRRLALAQLTDEVQTVFRVSGFAKILTICPTLEAALTAARA